MKVGDKVIYIFDPYTGPLDNIIVARLTRLPNVSMFDKNPAIKPIKSLIGKTGMHEQIAKSNYLYELGDHKVIKIIFEKRYRK